MRRSEPGFTLIELIAVCAILGVLAAIALPAVGTQIARARVAAEAQTLHRLAAAAQASFESTDLEGTNLAALPGSIPAGVDATAPSPTTDPAWVPATTAAADWFAKLTRAVGDSPQLGVAPTQTLQPRVAANLFNPNRLARILLIGPLSEAGQQRFLLLSLMAPPGTLALPPLPNPANSQDPANLALFNDTWNVDWTSPAAALPPAWIAGLTAAQAQAWQGTGGGSSRLWQLCAERIVCSKFTVVVNNSHPSDNCYIYYNLNGTNAGASTTVAANAGTYVISGVYAGRTIQAYRGTSGPPAAQLFAQFILRDHCEITLQD